MDQMSHSLPMMAAAVMAGDPPLDATRGENVHAGDHGDVFRSCWLRDDTDIH